MSVQLDLNLTPPAPKKRTPLPDHERKLRKEKEEAHRCFKIHKSGKPWRFSDRERKLLKDYYGISIH